MDPMRTALTTAGDAWNRGDLERYLELYHPDITLHGYSPEPMGKSAVRGFYRAFFEAFPGVQLAFDAIVSEGSLLMVRFHCDVLHRGPFMGAPATGRAARIDGHTSMRFAGTQVVERWSTADFLGLMTQLGMVRPPG
jgi:predicted ester cyclase